MLQTGLVYKDGEIIAHRSYRKIFFNPLLRRLFGKAIGSIIVDRKFTGYKIIDQTEPRSWTVRIDFEYDYIEPTKRI